MSQANIDDQAQAAPAGIVMPYITSSEVGALCECRGQRKRVSGSSAPTDSARRLHAPVSGR